MVAKFFLITLIMLGVTLSTTALSCRRCGTYECPPLPADCPWGTVKDPCFCCLVCAKGLNEICGGVWNISGKCGEGLKCVKDGGSDIRSFIEAGRCQKI
uniref:Venom toxin n=1 Tax=Hemiscorpius lepturus TaxID=520031 RepID=A0A1L4BJ49_HEMLE|nr:venom toxin [Hemiscorpius lepturus]